MDLFTKVYNFKFFNKNSVSVTHTCFNIIDFEGVKNKIFTPSKSTIPLCAKQSAASNFMI